MRSKRCPSKRQATARSASLITSQPKKSMKKAHHVGEAEAPRINRQKNIKRNKKKRKLVTRTATQKFQPPKKSKP